MFMTSTYNTQEEPIRAFLVGLDDVEHNIGELQGLVHTLSFEIVESYILPPFKAHSQFLLGSGKAKEIHARVQSLDADCIIFDFEISPTQQRNWERLTHIPVFDRNEVIIRIFGERAQTKEAKLQVELARLQYSLPRLAHSYGDMARQRGGSYGSKGTGETQLELDRRGIQKKIAKIKLELQKVIKERNTMRKKRENIPLPNVALVGYTNAGKSSLLNVLTGSDVFVEDSLFATLDPTTRRLNLSGKTGLLLTDTVGFIKNLPHSLIDSFKATLEEAVRASLLIIVLDGSDPDIENQYETVCSVLEEIGAFQKERIIALNKIDLLDEKAKSEDSVFFDQSDKKLFFSYLEKTEKHLHFISSHTKEGLKELTETIFDLTYGLEKTFHLSLHDTALIDEIRNTGVLVSSEWTDTAIIVKARVKPNLEAKILGETYQEDKGFF